MDLLTVYQELDEILERTKIVYLRTTPEIPDFTNHSPTKIILSGGGKLLELDLTRQLAPQVLALLETTVFSQERVSTLLTWNVKALMSYLRAYATRTLVPTTSVIDLQVIENFLGMKKQPPENLVEAVNRSKTIAQQPSWKQVYKTIHLPLMFQVLPEMETLPLLDQEGRHSVHAYYELEGQSNGRMRCWKAFEKSYVPHTLGPDQKANLKLRDPEELFLCADIRYCEVAVLQHLSGDRILQSLLQHNLDLHTSIYELVTGDACDSENKRNLSKIMFLPVIYGCGPGELAKNLKVPEAVGRELIRRMQLTFPTAFEWILNLQRQAEAGETILDAIGRPRRFEEKPYLVRNFVVQGVAATICLEKLILLQTALKEFGARLCFSIHDGYGIICSPKTALPVYKVVKSILESESSLCPGLRFKSEVKLGRQLNEMRVVGKSV